MTRLPWPVEGSEWYNSHTGEGCIVKEVKDGRVTFEEVMPPREQRTTSITQFLEEWFQ